jgi:PKD domain-containing protein/FG-GAP repeat protein/lactonase family protein with 7-bladed beta-propeller/hemolysin type calcium-binding protein
MNTPSLEKPTSSPPVLEAIERRLLLDATPGPDALMQAAEVLGLLQTGLDDEVLARLPVAGEALADGLDVVRDVIDEVQTGLDMVLNDVEPALIQQELFGLLGPQGSGILLDSDDPGEDLSAADVSLTVGPDETDFGVRLGGTIVSEHLGGDFGFDVGLPGLGLTADVSVEFEVGWEWDLGFGLDAADDFYVDTSSDSEMQFIVSAGLGEGSGIEGQLGFLRLSATDFTDADDLGGANPTGRTGLFGSVGVDLRDPGGDGRLTWTEMTDPGTRLGDVVVGTVSAGADVNLAMSLDFGGAMFPSLSAELDVDWDFLSASTDGEANTFGASPVVAFNDVQLDLGSFLSDFAQPILDEIRKVTEPLEPVLDILTMDIPVISDLAGPTSILDLAATLGLVDQGFVDAVETVDGLIRIVNNLPTGDQNIVIQFGDMAVSGPDLREEGSSLSDATTTPRAFDIQGELNRRNASSSTKNFVASLGGGGLRFPILTDPMTAFNLLAGKTVDLFVYDMPKLALSFDYDRTFPIFYILSAHLEGEVSAAIDLSFGYDTHGLEQMLITGDPLDLAQGFYVGDWSAAGVEKPELAFHAGIGGGVSLYVWLAEAGVMGGIFGDIGFDLRDPNHDGKVRMNELEDNYRRGPKCIFDIHGELTAGLYAFYWVGMDFGWFGRWTWDEGRYSIATESWSFDYGCGDLPDSPPVLAELNAATGQLLLNMGPRSALRLYGDTSDGDEAFTVVRGTGDKADRLIISAFGYRQEFAAADVSTIVGYGGAGDDRITIARDVEADGDLHGGDGADRLRYDGKGSGTLFGDAGDDELTGGDQGDQIYGGPGADRIQVGEGNDVADGGEGDDVIFADSGVNALSGGAGDDKITGGRDADVLSGGPGADTLHGAGGDDQLAGGADGDRFVWNVGDGRDTVVEDASGAGEDQAAIGGSVGGSLYAGSGDDEIAVRPWGQGFEAYAGAGYLRAANVEGLAVVPGQGADEIRLQDPAHLGARSIQIDLSRTTWGPVDLAPDTVTFIGSSAADEMTVRGVTVEAGGAAGDRDAAEVSHVAGESMIAHIYGAEATRDTILLDGNSGMDQIEMLLTPGEPRADELARLELTGGAGEDLLRTPYGDVKILGGDGVDALEVYDPANQDPAPAVTVHGSAEVGYVDVGTPTDSRVTYSSVENVHLDLSARQGPSGADVLNTTTAGLLVTAGDDGDTVTVHAARGPVTIDLGAGPDTVHLGDGNMHGLLSDVTVASGFGDDRLILNDEDDLFGRTVTLNGGTAAGLPTGGAIVFGDTETVELRLGRADDSVIVDGVDQHVEIVDAAGTDTLEVRLLRDPSGAANGPGVTTVGIEAIAFWADALAGPTNWLVDAGKLRVGAIGSWDQVLLDTYVASEWELHLSNVPANPDTVQVLRVIRDTWVDLRDGPDVADVGLLPSGGLLTGNLDEVDAELRITGSGADLLGISDAQDSANIVGRLGPGWADGFNMSSAGRITWDGMAQVDLKALGGGASEGYSLDVLDTTTPTVLQFGARPDALTVQQASNDLDVRLGAGDDVVTLVSSAGALRVDGQDADTGDVFIFDGPAGPGPVSVEISDDAGATLLDVTDRAPDVRLVDVEGIELDLTDGADRVTIQGTGAGGIVAIDGRGGDDAAVVERIDGTVSFQGGDDHDVLTVLIPGDPSAGEQGDLVANLSFAAEQLVLDNSTYPADVAWQVADGMVLAGGTQYVRADGADELRILAGSGSDALSVEETATPVTASVDGNRVELVRGTAVLDPAAYLDDTVLSVTGHDPVSNPLQTEFELTALSGPNGFQITGGGGWNSFSSLGFSVDSAGDFNGDGFDDLVVGDRATNSWGLGEAYIIFGSPNSANINVDGLNGANGIRIVNNEPWSDFGNSVSSAGDVNHDGYDDVIIGAPHLMYGNLEERKGYGASFVIFGGPGSFPAAIDVDNLDGTNGFRIDGVGFWDLSGASVSGGGDINGDHIDDLLIGAPQAYGYQGEAYVVYGHTGAFPAAIPLAGLAPADGCALRWTDYYCRKGSYSVSIVGDVNGDGADDMLLGATNAGTLDSNGQGMIHLVYGGGYLTALDASDGAADGAARLWNRYDGFDPQYGLHFDNYLRPDYAGFSVSGAGDVNDDGYADLLLGVPGGGFFTYHMGAGSGRTYLLWGGPTNLTALDGADGAVDSAVLLSSVEASHGLVFLGTALSDSGSAVAGAGDVNADGVDDVVVGAWMADDSGMGDSGAAYVVFGGATLTGFDALDGTTDGTAQLALLGGEYGYRIDPAAAGDKTGFSVASAGDVNGDGRDDLIVGSPREWTSGIAYPGKAHVLFGASSDYAYRDLVSMTASPDGMHLYALRPQAGELVVLDAQTLLPVQGLRDGFDNMRGLAGARALALSPDGQYVYVASPSYFLTFSREASNGILTLNNSLYVGDFAPSGWFVPTSISVSPDGHTLLVGGDRAWMFHHVPGYNVTNLGAFSLGNGLHQMALSPDGRTVYGVDPATDALVVIQDTMPYSEVPLLASEVEPNDDGVLRDPTSPAPIDPATIPLNDLTGSYAPIYLGRNRTEITGEFGEDWDFFRVDVPADVYATLGVQSTGGAPGRLFCVEYHPDGTWRSTSSGSSVSRSFSAGSTVFAIGAEGADPGTYVMAVDYRGLVAESQRLQASDGLPGLRGASALAVVADETREYVYVTGTEGNAVSVFARESDESALTLVQVVREGLDGVRGIARPDSVVASSDGRYLYVASSELSSLAVFERDAETGRLQLAQVFRCNSDAGVQWPQGLTTGAEGDVFIASGMGPRHGSGGIGVFDRTMLEPRPGEFTVTFDGVEDLAVITGSHEDVVKLTRPSDAAQTHVNTGGGGDEVHVVSIAGVVDVETGEGSDLVEVRHDDPAELTVHTGAGSDTVGVYGSSAGATTALFTDAGDDWIHVTGQRLLADVDIHGGDHGPGGDVLVFDAGAGTTPGGSQTLPDGDVFVPGLATTLYAEIEWLDVIGLSIPDAGGPHAIAEGDALSLDATGTVIPAGRTVEYAWDVNGDGVFGEVTDATADLAWDDLASLGLGDDGTYVVALQVRDDLGEVVYDSATLTIANTAPALSADLPATAVVGAQIVLALGATDPGDDRIARWEVDWGDGTSLQVMAGASGSLSHVYLQPGQASVAVRAWDEDAASPYETTALVDLTAPAPFVTGPTELFEGGELHLLATAPGSADMAWDVNDDGVFGDVSGAVLDLSWAELVAWGIADNGSYGVAVEASWTGLTGATVIETTPTQVIVRNAAPTGTLSLPATVVQGSTAVLSFVGVTDPSPVDQASGFTYSFDLNGDGLYNAADGDVIDSPVPTVTLGAGLLADVGTLIVQGRVTDRDGGAFDAMAATQVIDAPPALILDAPGSVLEGQIFSLTLSANDPGSDEIATWTVQWGDGTQESLVGPGGALTHVYADNAARMLTVAASDEHGVYQAQRAVEVLNVVPTVLLSVPSEADEGDEITVHLSATDPGDDQVTEWTVDWGDGTEPRSVPAARDEAGQFVTDVSLSHRYPDDGIFTVSAWATDEDGTHGPTDAVITVRDVAPSSALSAPATVVEDTGFALQIGPASDPGDDTVTHYIIHWDDGSAPETVAAPSPETEAFTPWLAVHHVYATGDAVRTIAVDAIDDGGTHAAIATAEVEVLPSALRPVDDRVEVSCGSLVYDRGTGLYGVTVTIAHTSGEDVSAPVYLVLQDLTPESVTVSDPAGFIDAGDPYVDLSDQPALSDGLLSSGEVATVQVWFENPAGLRFDFTPSVWAVPVVPPVTSLPADADGDGLVTDADYTIWADHYGATDADRSMGDFNGDGRVTDADYSVWADSYQSAVAAAGAVEESSPALVTEPTLEVSVPAREASAPLSRPVHRETVASVIRTPGAVGQAPMRSARRRRDGQGRAARDVARASLVEITEAVEAPVTSAGLPSPYQWREWGERPHGPSSPVDGLAEGPLTGAELRSPLDSPAAARRLGNE